MALKFNGIRDAGVPLVVDPFTRRVTVPATERVIGVVGDHCSEQVTFQIPRTIDHHDMQTSTRLYVSWRNVDGEPGSDELEVIEVTEDTILLGWTIRDKVAAAKGLVDFSLHFECYDSGKLIYRWGTHTCSSCEILDSVNATLGAYAAIYIDDETLVFADYNPVHDEALDLTSCIAPTGTLEISEEGKHDVGRYAYADVKGVYETPIIEISEGVVKATANGLEAERPLDPIVITQETGKVTATANGMNTTATLDPDIQFAKTTIHFSGTAPAYIDYQEHQADGVLVGKQINTITEALPDSLQLPPGSFMRFMTILNTAPSVTCSGYPLAVIGTVSNKGGTIESTLLQVPNVPGATVEIKFN